MWTRIRTSIGTSHSVYCGECTLCSNRNPHSMAADTAIHGYVPSRLYRSQPRNRASANEASTRIGDHRLTRSWNSVFFGSESGRNAQNQIEFVVMSACRRLWNVNDARQPSKPNSANGRFTRMAVDNATSTVRKGAAALYALSTGAAR